MASFRSTERSASFVSVLQRLIKQPAIQWLLLTEQISYKTFPAIIEFNGVFFPTNNSILLYCLEHIKMCVTKTPISRRLMLEMFLNLTCMLLELPSIFQSHNFSNHPGTCSG